ncbi:MAG: hypothetical protein ACPG8W_02765 [Candidatus Promineifilaceae bacterium]
MNTIEKRLYVENALSQQLILFWLAGNTAFTLLYVNNMAVTSRLGIFVMLNIGLSLIAFLVAVRQKVYLIQWGYIGLGLALFQFARLFWIPVEIVNSPRLIIQILLVATSAAALIGSIVCIQRTQERQKYIEENNIDLAIMQK